MNIEDRTVSQLREYLGDREVNRDGLKEKLVVNVYGEGQITLKKFVREL